MAKSKLSAWLLALQTFVTPAIAQSQEEAMANASKDFARKYVQTILKPELNKLKGDKTLDFDYEIVEGYSTVKVYTNLPAVNQYGKWQACTHVVVSNLGSPVIVALGNKNFVEGEPNAPGSTEVPQESTQEIVVGSAESAKSIISFLQDKAQKPRGTKLDGRHPYCAHEPRV